jgi:hypothetical protein
MKLFSRTAPLNPRMTHNTTSTGKSVAGKTLLLAVAFALLSLSPLCHAQTQETSLASSIEVVRADTQADRVTIITQAMNFTDKEAEAFWPIYRKYEYERSTLDDRRVAVIKDYTAKYPNLSDADAKGMAEKMIDCDSQLAELKKKYYKKFNAALPALTVTTFFQVEHRVDLLMDMRVESSLPPLVRPGDGQEEPRRAQDEN